MNRSVTNQILRRIRAKRRAWVFTPKDFVDMGSREAVDQTLHRLADQEIIQRLDRGIYYFPLESERVPASTPSHIDAIARAIAAQTGDRAMLTGEEAARRLNLIDSVPPSGSYDYLTTGRSKQRMVGEIELRFRHISISPPDTASDSTINVIMALLYLGRDRISPDVMQQCAGMLLLSEREQLRKLAPQAPAWLIPILHVISTMQETQNAKALSAHPDHKDKIIEPA